MIRGEVLKLRDKLLPLVSLDIKTGNGELRRIVAIVDPGNDCDLVMRGERLTDLGLKFDEEQTTSVRGVHSDVDAPTCRTDAIWDEERTSVEIVEGNTPTTPCTAEIQQTATSVPSPRRDPCKTSRTSLFCAAKEGREAQRSRGFPVSNVRNPI